MGMAKVFAACYFAVMRRYIILTTLFLVACTTGVPLQEVMRDVNQQWAGQSADAFFLDYGKPVGQSMLESGTRYRWVSILEPPSGMVSPLHNFRANGKSYGFLDPNAESRELRYCELHIDADRKELIRQVALVHDDIGKHSNSLCSEIFGSR